MVILVLASTVIGAETLSEWLLYIGTYTGGASEGIYQLRLDAKDGVLENPGLAGKVENPSFLAVHTESPYLFSVGEGVGPSGKKEGLASAFVINEANGLLTLVNQQPTVGEGPCHAAVDRAGSHLLIANYGSGSVTVFPIGGDGRLGPATDLKQHSGSSAHPNRQTGPHTHSVTLDAAGNHVMAADLGLDKILVYQYDSQAGVLQSHVPPFVALAPGAGPRHFAFHPSGRFAYVVNELKSTVTAFAYDSREGNLEELQTIGTLPSDFIGENYTAEIRVHPSGRFLYVSNRGHDSITRFSVEEGSGRLTCLGHTPTGGKVPRNFAVSPDGVFLVAANQQTGNVTAFRINTEDGTLDPTGDPVDVPTPVCVLFYVPHGGIL